MSSRIVLIFTASTFGQSNHVKTLCTTAQCVSHGSSQHLHRVLWQVNPQATRQATVRCQALARAPHQAQARAQCPAKLHLALRAASHRILQAWFTVTLQASVLDQVPPRASAQALARACVLAWHLRLHPVTRPPRARRFLTVTIQRLVSHQAMLPRTILADPPVPSQAHYPARVPVWPTANHQAIVPVTIPASPQAPSQAHRQANVPVRLRADLQAMLPRHSRLQVLPRRLQVSPARFPP